MTMFRKRSTFALTPGGITVVESSCSTTAALPGRPWPSTRVRDRGAVDAQAEPGCLAGADGLGAGQPAIVIATAERRGEILTALYDRLIPCDREIQAGRLTLFDASATLQLFMDGSGPDPARFETTFGAVIEYTQRRHGAAP